jgi:hypothetical protein
MWSSSLVRQPFTGHPLCPRPGVLPAGFAGRGGARSGVVPNGCLNGVFASAKNPVLAAQRVEVGDDRVTLKGDSYRLKDRDLGRVPTATTEE